MGDSIAGLVKAFSKKPKTTAIEPSSRRRGDEAAEKAKRDEEGRLERLRRGTSTRKSGTLTEALSANVGKSQLGGSN